MKISSRMLYKKVILGIITAGIIATGGLKFASTAKSVEASTPCIITISGVQYDVAPLTVAGVHPGGNVFVCGTDMTALFMSMPTHATDIARMTPYIYVPPTATPTPTHTPSPSPLPSVSPTVTPSPLPSVTPLPSPSISPTPIEHREEGEVEELNEEMETKQEEKNNHHEEQLNHGGEVRVVAKENIRISHHETKQNDD
jgi:hypothetical protein